MPCRASRRFIPTIPCLGHASARGRTHRERDAEVHHHRSTVVQQDVLGLDVSVNDAVPVRVVECIGDFPRNANGFVHAELRLAVQLLADRLALDVGHHVEQERVRRSRIEERQNVRMLQRRRRLDLHQESVGAEHRGEFRLQHLDRDLAIVFQIFGEIDRSHAAGAELALDAVAARKGGGEAGSDLSQRSDSGAPQRRTAGSTAR